MQDKDTLCDANHFIKGLQPLNSIVGLTQHGVVLLHPLNGTTSVPRHVQGPQASSFGKITRWRPYTLRVSIQSRPTASLFDLRPQINLRSRCFGTILMLKIQVRISFVSKRQDIESNSLKSKVFGNVTYHLQNCSSNPKFNERIWW